MQAIFLELVKLSLIGSLFAAAVMLVRLILPKTPKWIICLLWGVVALRLICPVSIESNISLVPDRIASGQIITNIGDEYIGDVNVIYENNEEYSDAVEAGRQPIQSGDGYYVVTEADSLEAPKTVEETLYPILSWVWMAGVVLMLGYTVASYLMLRRKMAEATLLRDNIWQCEQVDSPFVLGFIKPRIYLPYVITEADMANVIAHEKAHIHRKDHWWKPIGFILLSLHWFNPILWLAYILLCRDIEAACDEKVIKYMEKDEKRAYSTALLNCSVNRRRIAACPLAFGEVGVKERVKTVMNYKKPAFWIVIAAVALCIVVAVSFLTNPKDNGPEVGNPQMLEIPGVEWFVTPDELKEALNITEEQIIEEYTTSGYIIEMWVTDLTLYGRDVPFAKFSFWFDNNGNTALRRASVCFSEDTDMNKLKKELIEIYGPGKAEAYRYSLYDNNTDRNGRFGRRISSLEAAAENEIYQNVVEGFPFRDALEDPEYMTHHWVTENGLSIIPEEVVEYFRSAEDEQMPQDEDAFMEKLDQMPWVVISMANRHPAAIINEIKGTEFEWEALETNNCMTFSADLLAEYLYTVKVEQVEDATTATDPSLLEIPGVKWNMTPEEVKKNLGLTADQILVDTKGQSSELMDTWVLTVTEVPFFGEEVAQAQFQFVKYAGYDKYGLDSVRIYYPDEVDMAEVRDTLIGIYGEGNSIGITRCHISNGKVHSSVDDKLHASSIPDALLYCWESSSKGTDVLPKAVQEEIIAIYSAPDFDNFADRDVVLEYLEKNPLVTLYCTDSAGEGNLSADDLYTCNHVNFSASAYINYVQKYDK